MNGELLRACLKGAFEKLEKHKEEVNALNVFPVPDGDTGTNMTLTMKSAMEAVEKAVPTTEAMGKALGNGSLMGARGNSGVILSQLCRGIAQAVKGKENLEVEDFPLLFASAKEKAYKAVMKPTEGTILTVARAFSEFTEQHKSDYQDIGQLLKATLQYGNYILQKTPDMLPTLKEAGVVDAGGQGLIYLLQGFTETLTGEELDSLLTVSTGFTVEPAEEKKAVSDEFAYSVRFRISDIEKERMLRHIALHAQLESLSETDRQFAVEAFTNQPAKLLSSMMRRGSVEEYHLLHSGETAEMEEEENPEEKQRSILENRKQFGFVAVSLGDGFDAIFRELRVDEIVSGGQTMNPSTADLWKAVQKVKAETVYILPNNKNIIMAAEQVNELADCEVIVIPTRSIPQGFTALFQFDESLSAEENRTQMTESLSTVITGQVTYAIRDTEINGITIHKGDQIGLVDGDIVASAQDPEQLVEKMIAENITDEASLLNLYRGEEADSIKCEALAEKLEARYPDLDFQMLEGGQPIYRYIFSIE
ncbi:MAG: DAK2 domain-containing protein [Peptoniphilaceae bacterium]|nr:DAK2 domain-containing protein [Peptoniphilaceae bacterium]MDY4196880.1 DAK2 domain-containing protein [Peptoniphilaceae bacterium]MDY6146117.1 DAK2 domain-containing protein [Peptoniphilaceae bacterium]